MSIKLARVTGRMVHHNVTGIRYHSNNVYSSIHVPFKFKQFSSDVKRKSAAYDRIGVTCAKEYLKSGEVMLEGGDYIVMNLGTVDEEWTLVARLVLEQAAFPWSIDEKPTQYSCEAYSCNVLIDVLSKTEVMNADTGIISEIVGTTAVDIRGSIASAEFYYQEPNNEPKDEFFLRLPKNINVPMNSIIEIKSGSIVHGLLQHDKYIVKYAEPDAQGVSIYRLGESEEAENVG